MKPFFALALLSLFFAARLVGQQEQAIILEDGTYFNGKSFEKFKELRIEGGKIVSLSDQKSNVKCRRIIVAGKYIIPGLTDAHVHISGSPAYPYTGVDPLLNANSSLLCGVTTNVDLFFPETAVKSFEDSVQANPQLYSSFLMAGPILTAPGGHGTEYGVPTRTISTVEEAIKVTQEVASKKEIQVIKLVYQAYTSNHFLSKEIVKAIVATAHQNHKKVLAHIDVTKEAMDCIDAGVDGLAHLPADQMTEGDLQKLKKTRVVVIPTITVYKSLFEGQTASYMSDSLLWSTVHPDYMDRFERKALSKPPGVEKFSKGSFYKENLRKCIAMNIPILAGTDAGNYAVFYGYSLHSELQDYVLAGMKPGDALCSATQNLLTLFPSLKTGRIASGYLADLIVLNADPLQNIENTKQIAFVIHEGRIAQKIDVRARMAKSEGPVAFHPESLDVSALDTLPAYIYTYTDEMAGGSSAISARLPKDVSGKHYLEFKGTIVKKGFIAFAGAGFALAGKSEELPVSLSDYKGLEFDVKGNGETYYVRLISKLVKDYNYNSASFVASAGWTTVKLSFEQLQQSPWFGKQIKLDLETITALRFEGASNDYKVDLSVKNIRFTK